VWCNGPMAGEGRWRIDVLGPVRVVDPDGVDATPDGSLQRRLLALLVLHRDHVVGIDPVIDALWGDHPPKDPVAALHNHVSRLRRALPEDALGSTADGYRLSSTRLMLDV